MNRTLGEGDIGCLMNNRALFSMNLKKITLQRDFANLRSYSGVSPDEFNQIY